MTWSSMVAEVVVGAKIIAKLVGPGLAAYRAVDASGIENELESSLKAIQDVLDAGGQLATRTAKVAPRIQARHVALVSRVAWESHCLEQDKRLLTPPQGHRAVRAGARDR